MFLGEDVGVKCIFKPWKTGEQRDFRQNSQQRKYFFTTTLALINATHKNFFKKKPGTCVVSLVVLIGKWMCVR